MSDIIKEVFDVIEDRRHNPVEGSYVAGLNEKGENGILKKIGEETVEFVTAVKAGTRDEAIHEAADLIFHTMIALSHKGVAWEEVLEEFRRRKK
jgi:phosphoribosyl-ATP pyrophosphohydrolase